MTQLAIYLDEKTAALLDEAARKDGLSRSAWVKRAIQSSLTHQLPESFFDVLGTWEDERSSEEIIREIRNYPNDTPRVSMD